LKTVDGQEVVSVECVSYSAI